MLNLFFTISPFSISPNSLLKSPFEYNGIRYLLLCSLQSIISRCKLFSNTRSNTSLFQHNRFKFHLFHVSNECRIYSSFYFHASSNRRINKKMYQILETDNVKLQFFQLPGRCLSCPDNSAPTFRSLHLHVTLIHNKPDSEGKCFECGLRFSTVRKFTAHIIERHCYENMEINRNYCYFHYSTIAKCFSFQGKKKIINYIM